jgi:hypothetical protein
MPDVFIAYCPEDQTIGRQLAEALERAGYTTWCAERDAVPGPTYSTQVSQAVKQSRFMLLVVSPDAIISADLARTVELARSLRKPIIGLTLGLQLDLMRALDYFLFLAPHRVIPIPEEGVSAILPIVTSLLERLVVLRPARPLSLPSPAAARPPAAPEDQSQPVDRGAWPMLGGRSGRKSAARKTRARARSARAGSQRAQDVVHFTVVCPEIVQPASWFLLDAWAHLDNQRREVVRRARAAARRREIAIRSKGPVQLPGECVLSVRLQVEGMVVETPEDTILWRGEVANASFVVKVPEDAAEGRRRGEVAIWANGLLCTRLYFELSVRAAVRATTSLMREARLPTKAFASYASDDRDEVLKRVQGMQKVAPDLEVIVDVVKLRSGENWQTRLREEILSSDVLYLFWSRAASQSENVDWEWRCGFRERGGDFIDPVPLAPPEEVPPPRELADKHFNDWVLAYIRSQHVRNLA